MDGRVSSTEMESSVSDKVQRDAEFRDCEIRKCHSEECNDTRDVIKDIPTIFIGMSDEDDSSEELLSDVESTETRPPLATDLRSSDDCGRELAATLQERARKLWLDVASLRKKLNEETALWRKEKEFQRLHEENSVLAFEEATAAARSAVAAYAIESPVSNDLNNIVDVTSKCSIPELVVLEYKMNLVRNHDWRYYEDAEQRYNAYKHELVNACRRRLSEIEQLCKEELENIQQNASLLQSFEEIASRWSTDVNDHGDTQCNSNGLSDVAGSSKIAETSSKDCGKLDNEVNMIPEILSARFKREETA
ncbi:hypothetical protein PUN28_019460 [Cardiocondyla obscurior]|uniref:Uncharacterized protein n=1 Tax=Cardiocondyla obscurior TaxID=286306 RepID=A0AAW2ECF1_9HYME